jgi:hypothetical protein
LQAVIAAVKCVPETLRRKSVFCMACSKVPAQDPRYCTPCQISPKAKSPNKTSNRHDLIQRLDACNNRKHLFCLRYP